VDETAKAADKKVDPQIVRSVRLGEVFRPAAPIDRLQLFAGRSVQRHAVIDVILQPGRHAALYGERGVGKTSLALTLQEYLRSIGEFVVAARENCDETDDFTSVWRKVFTSLRYEETKPPVGLSGEERRVTHTAGEQLQDKPRLTPDDVKRVLGTVGQQSKLIVIIDEFDRISDREGALFADTIKTLSDQLVEATVILVGVADTVTTLIKKHESVERALAQIRVPRMSEDELTEIVRRGLAEVTMKIDPDAQRRIIALSHGLPHYTHLVALNSARRANNDNRLEITKQDVEAGIADAVEQAQETIVAAHHRALMSPRATNILREVALACAVARSDDRGFFRASDVRGPLRIIADRPDIEVSRYMKHIDEFCEPVRGPILEKTGTPRNYRFRFINPLLQPYIIMDGMKKKLLDDAKFASLSMSL